MHEWHWISSAVTLVALLFFAVTGITLNHAGNFESPQQSYATVRRDIPASLVAALNDDIRLNGEGESGPTEPLRIWVNREFGVETGRHMGDWKTSEIVFAMERPGGDAWLKLDLLRAVAEYHVTEAGWVAYLNDLHKGRHTGTWWSWLLDLAAVACVVFAITGFVILVMHARNRSLTWPLVAFGLLLPLLIAALFIH